MSYVLLVDDKEENLTYLRALFDGYNMKHDSAAHGLQALAKARQSPPMVALSDLLMPVMDGYALLREWKADPDLSKIPFVVYTATYTDSEDERLAVDLGADAFIQKVGAPGELVARLKQLIADTAGSSPASPRHPSAPEKTQLKEYNEALVRKLEAKTLQLHAANRALQQEIVLRREVADTQIAVLDALTAPIALIENSGTIVAVNEAWRRFACFNGLKHADYGIGTDYLGICDEAIGNHSIEAKPAAAGIRSVLSGQSSSFTIEYRCDPIENLIWFRMVVTPLRGPGLAGAVIMHVDVTDRRGAELKLQESEAQYLLLLNSTAEGIYRLDTDGICTFCNPTAARLLGYRDTRELVGRSAHEHHHHSRPDGTPFALSDCRVHIALDTDEGTHADNEVFFRADGSQFPVECWSYPILSGPDIAGRVVTFLDITQRQELEAQFLQSQKMEAVGRLAGGVAHDFNNSLQVILFYAELLEERLIDDAVGIDYNGQILSAGRRGASLTRQLLALSRKQLLRPVAIDIRAVINEIETMLRRTIGEDIALTINHAPNVGTIKADRGQIEQVLINLAVNARDAMPSGGELLIETSNFVVAPTDTPARAIIQPGNYVVLTIRDTGVGMDHMTQARIFEPFFTTKEPGQGTGLGLSTVYGIVNQSKGHIIDESNPGKGTEFRAFFPIVEGLVEHIAPREPVSRPLRGSETVFLVEDEHSLRSVVGATLRANGYRVLDAQDGHSAIQLANDFAARIDLLLTDVILPGVSGRTVAERLRVSRPEMKVIYMSGYTDDFIAHHGIIDPQTVLLEKPFPISLLLRTIREALDADLEAV